MLYVGLAGSGGCLRSDGDDERRSGTGRAIRAEMTEFSLALVKPADPLNPATLDRATGPVSP